MYLYIMIPTMVSFERGCIFVCTTSPEICAVSLLKGPLWCMALA